MIGISSQRLETRLAIGVNLTRNGGEIRADGATNWGHGHGRKALRPYRPYDYCGVSWIVLLFVYVEYCSLDNW
jgi:hypothetical protein